MNQELVKKFEAKICAKCKDKDCCSRKPTRLMKCGILYLATEERK